MYETHWTGLSRPSWEREMDLQLSLHEMLRHWAGTQNQHRQANLLLQYRWMRIARHKDKFLAVTMSGFWHPGIAACRTPIGFANTTTQCFPTGPTFGTRATTVWGGSEKSARLRQRMGNIWLDSWTARDRSGFLFLRRATRYRRELYTVLSLQIQLASAVARGLQRNVY